MKYFKITLLIVLIAGQAFGRSFNNDEINFLAKNAKSVQSSLTDFFEVKLREFLRNGNQTLGVPILDPFVNEQMIFNINEGDIKANMQLDYLNIEGLSNYTVKTAKIAILTQKLTLEFLFPKTNIKGFYDINANILKNINVFGDGKFDASIEDFSINAIIKVSIKNGLSIKSIDLKISLGALDVDVTGLFNDEVSSQILSELVSEIAPRIITDYHDQITDVIVTQATKIVNELLEGKSLNDLLGMLE